MPFARLFFAAIVLLSSLIAHASMRGRVDVHFVYDGASGLWENAYVALGDGRNDRETYFDLEAVYMAPGFDGHGSSEGYSWGFYINGDDAAVATWPNGTYLVGWGQCSSTQGDDFPVYAHVTVKNSPVGSPLALAITGPVVIAAR